MPPKKNASVRSAPTARATRSSVRKGTASLEEAHEDLPAPVRTTRSRATSSTAASVVSDETCESLILRLRANDRSFLSKLTKPRLLALVDALMVQDQQQEQQISQLEAKIEQIKNTVQNPAKEQPAVVVSSPADKKRDMSEKTNMTENDTRQTSAPAVSGPSSPQSPAAESHSADAPTTAAAPATSTWSFLTTPLRRIFALSPIAEEASSTESKKRKPSETQEEEERTSKRTKISEPVATPSPVKETPTRRSVKIARQQREARRLAAQYQNSPAPFSTPRAASTPRSAVVSPVPEPQKTADVMSSPSGGETADERPSPPSTAAVEVMSKKRKRVKIDDMHHIPSRLPGQSSGTFALLDDFFDLSADSVELDEDEAELYTARPAKMARTEHNVFDLAPVDVTSPVKDGHKITEPVTGSPAKDARTSAQSPQQTPVNPVSFTTGTPSKETAAEEVDFALTRKRSEAERYKPAVGSRLREMQRIPSGSSPFSSPTPNIAAAQSAFVPTTPVAQQQTYNFPATQPLVADIGPDEAVDDTPVDLSPLPESFVFPSTQPLVWEEPDRELSPIPERFSFPPTQPLLSSPA